MQFIPLIWAYTAAAYSIHGRVADCSGANVTCTAGMSDGCLNTYKHCMTVSAFLNSSPSSRLGQSLCTRLRRFGLSVSQLHG